MLHRGESAVEEIAEFPPDPFIEGPLHILPEVRAFDHVHRQVTVRPDHLELADPILVAPDVLE
jgi:hypothetical protein